MSEKKFLYRCDYKAIHGNICNKRCINPNRCSQHKESESYTQKCTYEGCNTYTKSKKSRCGVHKGTSVPAHHTNEVIDKLDKLDISDKPDKSDKSDNYT